ncbi:MAG TPA: GreA/GreB family elongation factor [Symbiobacteriaceae bacterium]|nr:GreA/GreB family elongation factor [Symbiobacteriaceae bacterium]
MGKYLELAGEEAANRVVRAIAGPPPTDEEAEILAHSAHELVRLYSRVLVTDLETGEQDQFRLVPEGEGDPLQGELSISSPIGRTLLMEYPGAVVAVKTPGGRRLFRILRVQG